MRLDKAVALTGLTRSEARRAIAAGRVRVEGQPVRDGAMQVRPEQVRVDGVQPSDDGPLYIMVNKPAGVLTATEDRRLPTVLDLLPTALRRRDLGPVGRLDRNVTGLVLLTSDGQLAHRLISPKWKAEKQYRAVCEGRLTQREVDAFDSGVELSDFTTRPARLILLEVGDDASTADVILTEGKFHQVKRMFAAVGHPLTALQRLRIGPLVLDPALGPGEWRHLSPGEAEALRKTCSLEAREEASCQTTITPKTPVPPMTSGE